MLLAVIALGVVRGALPAPEFDLLRERAPFLREITGTVVSYPEIGRTWQTFDLELTALAGKIRVTIWDGADVPSRITLGDILRIQGLGKVPEVDDGFDDRAYLQRQGIFARFSAGDGDVVERIGMEPSVWRAGDLLRQRMMNRVADALPVDEAAMALGLLFGMDGLLPTEDRDAFRSTGVAHLLAVSGLHLGLLLAVVWMVLRVLRVRRVIAYGCVICAAVAVLWVIGPRTSLVRATGMVVCSGIGMALADLGVISRRWVDSMRGIWFAALLVLVANPDAWCDVSFQLSFAATAAIVAGWRMMPRNDKESESPGFRGRVATRIRNLTAVSMWAQAGVIPVVAFQFGTFHPAVVVWNLIAVPWATLCLWTEAAFVAASRTPLAAPIASILTWELARFRDLMEAMGRFSISEVPVTPAMAVWLTGLVAVTVGAYYWESSSSSRTLKSTSIVSSRGRAPLRERGPRFRGDRRLWMKYRRSK